VLKIKGTLNYEGDFKNDVFHGRGVFANLKNNTTYDGYFINGKK